MKILLIKPCWPYPYSKNEYTYNRIWMPLELANCAAILEKNGFKPKILDCHALRILPFKLKKLIEGYDKIFVTSSSRDRWQCPNIDISPFIENVQEIRKTTDQVYVMGYHGTTEPLEILNATDAKAVIRGEPEEIVLNLCQTNDLAKVDGISYKINERIIHTPNRAPIDLSNLPVPAFHLFDFKNYSYEILGKNFSLFEINRGCEYKCTFCNQTMYGNKVRTKSADQVIGELTMAIENFNVRTGCFMDLHFLTNPKVVREVCQFLIKKKYKFTWACSTRADSIDNDIVLLMKEAGCRLVKMGVETAQQSLLDDVNKSLNLNVVEEAFELCRKSGMKTLAFFLFGLPGETKKDRELNLKFSRRLNPDFVSFHKMIPYKGTPIAKKNNVQSDKDLSKDIRKAYLNYYLRPSYLLRLSPSAYLPTLKLFWGRMCTLKN